MSKALREMEHAKSKSYYDLVKNWKLCLDPYFGDMDAEWLLAFSNSNQGSKHVVRYASILKHTNVHNTVALLAVLLSVSYDGINYYMPPTELCMENIPYAKKVLSGSENPKILINLVEA